MVARIAPRTRVSGQNQSCDTIKARVSSAGTPREHDQEKGFKPVVIHGNDTVCLIQQMSLESADLNSVIKEEVIIEQSVLPS